LLQIALLVGKLGLGGLAFLEHLARVWENYCSQLLLTRQIFLYLDRTYVISAGASLVNHSAGSGGAGGTSNHGSSSANGSSGGGGGLGGPGDARSIFDMGLHLFAAHLQAHPEASIL